MKFKWKRFLAFVISALIVWGAVVYVDYNRVMNENEKPYFTYIEDFVVFSNSLETLKSIIDDYVRGSTLDKKADFVDFKDDVFDV